jgi:hypothetical protein
LCIASNSIAQCYDSLTIIEKKISYTASHKLLERTKVFVNKNTIPLIPSKDGIFTVLLPYFQANNNITLEILNQDSCLVASNYKKNKHYPSISLRMLKSQKYYLKIINLSNYECVTVELLEKK